MPKTRLEYWRAKFEGNEQHDRVVEAQLKAEGWQLLVVWQCEIAEKLAIQQRLINFLGPRRCTQTGQMRHCEA